MWRVWSVPTYTIPELHARCQSHRLDRSREFPPTRALGVQIPKTPTRTCPIRSGSPTMNCIILRVIDAQLPKRLWNRRSMRSTNNETDRTKNDFATSRRKTSSPKPWICSLLSWSSNNARVLSGQSCTNWPLASHSAPVCSSISEHMHILQCLFHWWALFRLSNRLV